METASVHLRSCPDRSTSRSSFWLWCVSGEPGPLLVTGGEAEAHGIAVRHAGDGGGRQADRGAGETQAPEKARPTGRPTRRGWRHRSGVGRGAGDGCACRATLSSRRRRDAALGRRWTTCRRPSRSAAKATTPVPGRTPETTGRRTVSGPDALGGSPGRSRLSFAARPEAGSRLRDRAALQRFHGCAGVGSDQGDATRGIGVRRLAEGFRQCGARRRCPVLANRPVGGLL
jgi:hypothetical protein